VDLAFTTGFPAAVDARIDTKWSHFGDVDFNIRAGNTLEG